MLTFLYGICPYKSREINSKIVSFFHIYYVACPAEDSVDEVLPSSHYLIF